MPSPPNAPELLELDPEAHTGLTNIVSGRLAIFEAKATETPAADSHSAQPTPSKVISCPPCGGMPAWSRPFLPRARDLPFQNSRCCGSL